MTIGVKIVGADKVRASLTKAVRGGGRAAQEAGKQAAEDLLSRAQELAPVLTGDLIESGSVNIRGGSRFKKQTITVSFGTDHAVFAHEQISPAGPRGLGPGSRAKEESNRSPDGPVGGHFLSRPYQRRAPAYLKGIEKAVARGLAGKPIGKLFRGGVRRTSAQLAAARKRRAGKK